MKFRLVIKSKTIHGPDCGEQCNIDDADEVRTVDIDGMVMARYEDRFAFCDRLLGDKPKE